MSSNHGHRLRKPAPIRSGSGIVLVVTGDRRLAKDLSADLRELSDEVYVAHTPLEVIWRLAGEPFAVEAVFIDECLLRESAAVWQVFVADLFPLVRKVLVVPGRPSPISKKLLLSGRVQAVLVVPWDGAHLREAAAQPRKQEDSTHVAEPLALRFRPCHA